MHDRRKTEEGAESPEEEERKVPVTLAMGKENIEGGTKKSYSSLILG